MLHNRTGYSGQTNGKRIGMSVTCSSPRRCLGLSFKSCTTCRTPFDLSSFTWGWAVNEDFNIKHTDVICALQRTDESGALISIPAFAQVGSDDDKRKLDYPMQGPDPDCPYRYAPVVEVISESSDQSIVRSRRSLRTKHWKHIVGPIFSTSADLLGTTFDWSSVFA